MVWGVRDIWVHELTLVMDDTTPFDFEFDGVNASDLWGGRCYGVVCEGTQSDPTEARLGARGARALSP